MVEFALLAPLFLLLLFAVIVGGVMINAQIQLSNAVRDGARAAAVCGDTASATTGAFVSGGAVGPLQLPDGNKCDDAHVQAYIAGLIGKIPGGGKVIGSPNIKVYDLTNTALGTSMQDCKTGYKVEVSASYAQPMFLPLIDNLLGDNGSTNRTLKADAQATCEN